MWWLYVILYIIFAVIFIQFYRISTKTMKNAGALTILLQLGAGVSILLLCPFYKIVFPSDIKIYLFLLIATIFYAISDRINTTVRSGIEASTFSIIHQLSTVFMIIAGLVFFKEPFVITKIIGSALIIFSNILIFYQKGKVSFNRYIMLGILANISFTIALFLDVNISDNFNLPIYVALTLIIPALMLFFFEKIKFQDMKKEYLKGNKHSIIITALSWGVMILVGLRAYQLGDVTIVAPLCALTTIINVVVGYLFLKEKEHLFRKLIAAALIILSIILIKL